MRSPRPRRATECWSQKKAPARGRGLEVGFSRILRRTGDGLARLGLAIVERGRSLSSIVFEEFVEERLAAIDSEADRQAAISEIRGAMQTLL